MLHKSKDIGIYTTKRAREDDTLRILFYIVHPAKYYLFRVTINKLRASHEIDILINTKDVLEYLIKNEGWSYTNIFPNGRNNSSKPSTFRSALNFILTVYRLERYLWGKKKYDKFVTDDSLVVNGWLRNIPRYIFNDNDITSARNDSFLFFFTNFVISPSSTDLGRFSRKKISFRGNKALAHLHPKYFVPNSQTIEKYGYKLKEFIILRLALLNATHDIYDNKGITDDQLNNIISSFNEKFEIIILAERSINESYNKYLYPGKPEELYDFIKYSKLVISDSGTIATEAAMLGTPNILINRIAKHIGVHKELEQAGLQYYFDDYKSSQQTILQLLQDKELEVIWANKLNNYLAKCDDLNIVFKNLVESTNE